VGRARLHQVASTYLGAHLHTATHTSAGGLIDQPIFFDFCLLLYLLQWRDPYGQSKSTSKLYPSFDAPYMQYLRPRVGCSFRVFKKNLKFLFSENCSLKLIDSSYSGIPPCSRVKAGRSPPRRGMALMRMRGAQTIETGLAHQDFEAKSLVRHWH